MYKANVTMHSEDQFKAIQDIQDLLADSRKNYKAIANRIDDDGTKEMLLRISAERGGMENELAQDLVQHDPHAKDAKGTVGGTFHRVLLTFRDILNDTSDVNVLVECERQDSELLGRYSKVLDSLDLVETSRATLARQYAEIARGLDLVRNTREAMEAVEH